ncbi:MAG: amidohydrolase family protein [Gammaproteobacteria bacterium]|nr:MAG: amidohydrolase family protein [Gammaproteobacteria bacterium]
MKSILKLFGTALLCMLGSFTGSVAESSQITVFRNVRLFDGEQLIESANVVVRGTRIDRVSDVGKPLDIPDGAELIIGDGLTLVPGLIDAHTHSFSRGNLERALDFGVTTSIDMWTPVDFMQQMQAEREQGIAFGRADMHSAGIGVTAPKSHGTQFGPVPTLSRPEDADAFVAARINEGSKYIKIIYDNFKMFDRPIPTLDYPTMEAVVESAHRRDRLVVVHSRDVDAYADVVRAGANGIAHIMVDEVPGRELIDGMRRQGMFVIPTLSISTPSGADMANDGVLGPRLSEKESANLRGYAPKHRQGGDKIAMESVRVLNEAGVTILAGSDSPNRGTATGVSIHQELGILVQAGLTPIQALVSATSAPADVFGLGDRGRIKAGLRADLLLVKGDPSSKISDTRRIIGVWKAGQRHALDQ